MHETDATTIDVLRVSSAAVAEWRSRSMSSLTELSFSMKVSLSGCTPRAGSSRSRRRSIRRGCREELAHLLRQLRGKRLVRREDQRGPLESARWSRQWLRLARPGDPEQGLEPLARIEACGQRLDRLRLRPCRIPIGHHLETVLVARVVVGERTRRCDQCLLRRLVGHAGIRRDDGGVRVDRFSHRLSLASRSRTPVRHRFPLFSR